MRSSAALADPAHLLSPDLLAGPASHSLASLLAALALGLAGLAVGRSASRMIPLFTRHEPHGCAPGAAGAPAPDTPAPAGPAPAGAPARDTAATGAVPEAPPPPRCPRCGARIPFHRWFPWVRARDFAARGRCPGCGAQIPASPAAAWSTALLFALVGAALPWNLPHWGAFGTAAVLFLAGTGVPLAAVDLRVHRLPDALVRPAYPVAIVLLTAALLSEGLPGGPWPPDPSRALSALAAMAGTAAFYWLLWYINPRGMGWGDVKLSGLLGLYLGWAAGVGGAISGTFLAFSAFSATGLVLLAARRVRLRETMPMGPFMVGAALAVVVFGDPLPLLL